MLVVQGMPRCAWEDGLRSSVLPDRPLRESLAGLDEEWFATDTALRKNIVNRRVLDRNGLLLVYASACHRDLSKVWRCHGSQRRVKCGLPARFETRTSRGWSTCGWTSTSDTTVLLSETTLQESATLCLVFVVLDSPGALISAHIPRCDG